MRHTPARRAGAVEAPAAGMRSSHDIAGVLRFLSAVAEKIHFEARRGGASFAIWRSLAERCRAITRGEGERERGRRGSERYRRGGAPCLLFRAPARRAARHTTYAEEEMLPRR